MFSQKVGSFNKGPSIITKPLNKKLFNSNRRENRSKTIGVSYRQQFITYGQVKRTLRTMAQGIKTSY